MVGEDRTDVAVEIEVFRRGDGGVAPDEHQQDESAAITRSLLIEGVSSHYGMPNLIHESAAPLQRCRAHSAANSYVESIHASDWRAARRQSAPGPRSLRSARSGAVQLLPACSWGSCFHIYRSEERRV